MATGALRRTPSHAEAASVPANRKPATVPGTGGPATVPGTGGPATVPATGRPATVSGTRERLLAAARELIEEGGYAAASVSAIAARAGLAAGTLYRHFESKERLFVELFRLVCEREERAVRDAVERLGPAASAVDRLQTVLGTFARRALRNRRLAWALIAEPVDPLVDAERIAHRGRYAQLIAAGLRAGMASGELPAQDAELSAAALVGGCGEALVGPLSPAAAELDVERVVGAIESFACRAVGGR